MHEHKHLSQADRVREYVLDQAVQAGKFPASRKEHYRRLYATDPDGTAALIDRLEPGLPPTDAPAPTTAPAPAAGGGHYAPPTPAPAAVPGDDYPREWLAPQDAAGGPARPAENITVEL